MCGERRCGLKSDSQQRQGVLFMNVLVVHFERQFVFICRSPNCQYLSFFRIQVYSPFGTPGWCALSFYLAFYIYITFYITLTLHFTLQFTFYHCALSNYRRQVGLCLMSSSASRNPKTVSLLKIAIHTFATRKNFPDSFFARARIQHKRYIVAQDSGLSRVDKNRDF